MGPFSLLNISMHINGPDDFTQLRQHIQQWKKKFPMFVHDVHSIERMVDEHIQNHSIAMVNYRQTRKKNFLEQAQTEIDAINRIVLLAEKFELMALLSNR